jgi:hypothetical protein
MAMARKKPPVRAWAGSKADEKADAKIKKDAKLTPAQSRKFDKADAKMDKGNPSKPEDTKKDKALASKIKATGRKPKPKGK